MDWWVCVFNLFSKYIATEQKKYAYLTGLSLLFHFSHILPVVILWGSIFIQVNLRTRILILILSFVVRFMNINLVLVLLPKISFLKGWIRESTYDLQRMTSIYNHTDNYRSIGNQFYLMRNDILSLTTILIFYFIYRKQKNIIYYNKNAFEFLILLFSAVNFFYADLIIFDRICKLFTMALLTYIFQFLSSSFISSKTNIFFTSLPLMVAVLYAMLTIVISQREYLWKIDLWFNSLFMM